MLLNTLLILNFIAYFVGGHEVFPVFGYGVTPWDISAIIIVLYAAKRILWNGDKPIVTKNYIYIGLIVFLGAVLLSTLTPILSGNGVFMLQTIKTTIHLIFYYVFFLSILVLNITKERLRVIFKALLIIAFITNVFAVYQLFARVNDWPLKFITFYNSANSTRGKMEDNEVVQLTLKFENFTRATSYMSEPSALANSNLIFLIIMLVPYLNKQKQYFKSKIFNTINLIFILTGLFLTFSLSGVIGLILFAFVGIFVHKTLSIKNLLKGLAISSIIIVAADLVAESQFEISVLDLFGQRITSILPFKNNKKQQIEGESLEHRVETFENSLRIWKEYPIFGIGIGLTSYHKEFDLAFSDTSIMAMMGEGGTIGGLALIILFGTILVYSYSISKDKKIIKTEDPDIKVISSMLMYYYVVIFSSNFLVSNQIINLGFWQIFIFIFMMINIIDNHRKTNLIEINLIKEGISSKLERNTRQLLS